jgi:gamma-glutamyl hercynylcysteine S-oxide synthase
MKKLLVMLIVFGLLAAACGGGGGATKPDEEESARPTIVFETPPPDATAAKLQPTNTPAPPPPTPTPKPTATPAPVVEEAAESTTEEAAQPEAPAATGDMVEVPAGPFTMGADGEDAEDAPAHEVDLPAFLIDRFEVTNTDFAAFVDATGYATSVEQGSGGKNWRDYMAGKENHPVVKVTWNDANAYCEWAGKRLPTEAEWEKAARGTDALRFPWGNEWDPSKANVKDTGLRSTAAVGSFGAGASPYGAEDMIGNVWEWTSDWYDAYPGNTASDPYYGEQCRSTRGGGWFDVEPQATTFNRNCAVPDITANDELGFRCAMSIK